VTISKTSSSPFSSTAIDQILQNLGIRNLIACGVATSSCVQMTVRDAADRNYGVLVVHDACTAVSEEMHHAALLAMEGFMGLVRLRSTDEVVHLLEELPLGAERSTVSTEPDRSARQESADNGQGSNT
jgi:nicotinamidase-related amidase